MNLKQKTQAKLAAIPKASAILAADIVQELRDTISIDAFCPRLFDCWMWVETLPRHPHDGRFIFLRDGVASPELQIAVETHPEGVVVTFCDGSQWCGRDLESFRSAASDALVRVADMVGKSS